MVKLLINCSFGHYPNNMYSHYENFALFLIINEDDNIRLKIFKKLKELNFNFGYNANEEMIYKFTAQNISV